MVRARDLLDHFRPVGAPGAASRTGVPADRLAEVTAELEAVWALLAPVEAEGRQVRAAALVEAARRQRQGAEQVAHLVASSREDTRAARAEHAGAVRAQGEQAGMRAVEQAAHEAEELRERALRRVPALVDVIVSDALATGPARPPTDEGAAT